MSEFQTLIHPTDFDEPSKEAFRVARSLAQSLGAQVIAFHVIPPPGVVTQDGCVLLGPRAPEPVDLWAEYRTLQAETPRVPVEYAIVVSAEADAKRILAEKVRELGAGVMLVMGSHGRTGFSKFCWGNKAEEAVRDLPCPVLVVKAPPPQVSASNSEAMAINERLRRLCEGNQPNLDRRTIP